MPEHKPASNAPFPGDVAQARPSSDESREAQSFGPQDVERPLSGDEGSASDEEQSSEAQPSETNVAEQSSERSERDQHHGSASDEEQSSEAQPSETNVAEQSSEPDQDPERDPGAYRFGPQDVERPVSGDEGSASDEEQSSERSERDQLIQERDALRELIQRVQADFVNYRKRAAVQSAADVERATGRLAEALLPVLDAAEAAYVRHPDEVGPLLNAMLSELRKHGLEMVDLENQPFDPEVADAVDHEAGDGGDVVVAEVLRSGYRWKGTTLRPAMVRTRG